MPWISERGAYGLPPEWKIWDLCDDIISSYQRDDVLIIPADKLVHGGDISRVKKTILEFLNANELHKIVLYAFVDPHKMDLTWFLENHISLERIFILPPEQSVWEFYMSSHAKEYEFVNPAVDFTYEFLCYQRKPNHYRPAIYELLKGLPGIVTIGDYSFDFNNIQSVFDGEDVMHNIAADQIENPSQIPKVTCDTGSLGNPDIWNKSFLCLVSETMSCPTSAFLSEKTFKPIMGFRPFVVIGGDQHLYDHLASLGYYTFEQDFPIFDGNVEPHVLSVVDYISSMDKTQYYLDNIEKLQHNHDNLCNADERILKQFKEFIESV